jgi:hypothetical protein
MFMTSLRGPWCKKREGPSRMTKPATIVNAQGEFSLILPKFFDDTAASSRGGSFRHDVGWRVVSGVRNEWV